MQQDLILAKVFEFIRSANEEQQDIGLKALQLFVKRESTQLLEL
jgi:hypothetical protein